MQSDLLSLDEAINKIKSSFQKISNEDIFLKDALGRCLAKPIISEIEFASRFIKHPIIAVTGSNGKSTTVNMVNEMLSTNEWKPILAGNIGNPFSRNS